MKGKQCGSVLRLAANVRLHAAKSRKPGQFAGLLRAPNLILIAGCPVMTRIQARYLRVASRWISHLSFGIAVPQFLDSIGGES